VTTALSTPESITALSFFLSCSARLRSVSSCSFRRNSSSRLSNRALANAGYQEEIDHRSYERQGLEKTPGIHLGKSACAMETRG
ncbi:MobA/MobL family protein, partial [Escherichia coli]